MMDSATQYTLAPLPVDTLDDNITTAYILIVEDNPVNQMLLKELLQKKGFLNIITADNGQEAKNFLQEKTPDLILLDLMMPDIDGFELCQYIRTQPKFNDIPIIIQTGLDNERERLSVFKIGANDLLTKPTNPAELLARVRNHLERRFSVQKLHTYQQVMEADLYAARNLQNLLLPDEARIKEVNKQYGIDIAAEFSPSQTIGGDFWGYIPLTDTQLAIYLGDFSGHGVTAAINVFRLLTILEHLPKDKLAEPNRCMQTLNAQLYRVLPPELYSTLCYGILDTQSNSFHYGIAGSPTPISLSSTGEYTLLEGSGLPIAATQNPGDYTLHTTTFAPGDSIILYSDALIETPDASGAFLDVNVLSQAAVNTMKETNQAQQILKTILDVFTHYTTTPLEADLPISIYSRNAVI